MKNEGANSHQCIAFEMFANKVTIWRTAPFVRFLVPLMTGIVIQWYLQLPADVAWYAFGFSLSLVFFASSLSTFRRFQFSSLQGLGIGIFFLALGSLLAWHKDIRHGSRWFGRNYQAGETVLAILQEPPIPKTNSSKALASVVGIGDKNGWLSARGNMIIYFEKDSNLPALNLGSQIVFSKTLQEIKSEVNPGGFDYKRYCLFQGITHQVFLKRKEFVVREERRPGPIAKILFPIRRTVLSVLRQYIRGEKERGLAEALLIGYKDDLDKNLVQSYTNTGVVHVIAISGLHLGLIYWLLVQICRPLGKKKLFKWVTPVTIIGGLWLFSLIAGAQPSVLRSAVMFTCIVMAESFSRKSSIYNSLAFSAFVLLCVNPYWLWDVGFQLSYAAVLSIVIFMKTIYNWFYIKNKILDFVWKLNAVSLAAQLLTTPFSIYHFHQFPNYFLFTNFIVVPLSSLVVLGEIFLCAACLLPFICRVLGQIISWLIIAMNSYIQRIESMPGSVWGGIQINIAQVALLITVVAAMSFWLIEKQRRGFWVGLFALLFFTFLRSYSFYRSRHQQMLIVYSIPKHQAMDLIEGRYYLFKGDDDLVSDDFTKNFYLRPSRVVHRITSTIKLPNLIAEKNFFQFGSRRIFIADQDVAVDSSRLKITVDVLVISKIPKLNLVKLSRQFEFRQVVFDASASARKIKLWKKDCDSLRVPYWDVSEKGAFVMKLN